MQFMNKTDSTELFKKNFEINEKQLNKKTVEDFNKLNGILFQPVPKLFDLITKSCIFKITNKIMFPKVRTITTLNQNFEKMIHIYFLNIMHPNL